MFGCVVIGITLSIIDIYFAENILVYQGSGRDIMAITTRGFCSIFIKIELKYFTRSLIKYLNN